jgi:hypothetical protein
VKAITTNNHTMANQKINNNTRIWVDKKWEMMIWVEWMVVIWTVDNMISRITIIKVSIQTNKLIQISWEETNHQIMDKITQTWMMDNQLTPTACSVEETETSMRMPKTKTREKQMNISTMLETSVIFLQIM